MGLLTRDDFIDEVRENIGGRGSSITDAQVIRKLNRSLQKIAARHDFRDMQRYAYATATQGEVFISSAEKVREIYSLNLLDNSNRRRKLVRVPERQWDKFFESTQRTSLSIPTHYNIWRGDIQLFPVPDDDYTLELKYTVYPAPFGSDESSANVVSPYEHLDDVLINMATGLFFLQFLQDVDAGTYLTQAERDLKAAILVDQSSPDKELVPDGDIQRGGPGEYWNNPFIVGVL